MLVEWFIGIDYITSKMSDTTLDWEQFERSSLVAYMITLSENKIPKYLYFAS